MKRIADAVVGLVVDLLQNPILRYLAFFVALMGLFKLLEVLQ